MKSVIHFFDQQPNIFLIKVFNIWFNFSIHYFESKTIFYFKFFDQLPFSFSIIFLPSYGTLFTTKITNKKHTFLSCFLNQNLLLFHSIFALLLSTVFSQKISVYFSILIPIFITYLVVVLIDNSTRSLM